MAEPSVPVVGAGLTAVPGPRGTTLSPLRISEGSVAAVLHAPTGGASGGPGIILCPPIFYEYQLCHRTMRSLAERLASTGAHVLRFDYRGTGDSGGDLAEVGPETWREDVDGAAAFLTDYLGRPPERYLGLRVGAAVALDRAIRDPDATGVFLWAPVLDGQAYAAELERTHAAWFDRYAQQHRRGADHDSRSGRVLGQPWPDAARARLETLAPPPADSYEGSVTLIETRGDQLEPEDRAALETAAPRLDVIAVDGPAPWRQDPSTVSPAVPARALETIARACATGGGS